MDLADFRALPPVGTSLSDDSELHVALADDRDAAAEARQLAALVDRPGPLRVVELFAGGGYHGRALAALGHEVHYVESSAAMKRYMVEQFGLPPQRYHLARAARLAGGRDAARSTWSCWPGSARTTWRRPSSTRWPTRLATVLRAGRGVGGGAAGSAVGRRTGTATWPSGSGRPPSAGAARCWSSPTPRCWSSRPRGDRPPVLWQSLTLTVTGPTGTETHPVRALGVLLRPGAAAGRPGRSRGTSTSLDVDVSAVFPQSDSSVPLRAALTSTDRRGVRHVRPVDRRSTPCSALFAEFQRAAC